MLNVLVDLMYIHGKILIKDYKHQVDHKIHVKLLRNNGKYDGYNQSKNEVYACLESNELHKPRRSRVMPITRD